MSNPKLIKKLKMKNRKRLLVIISSILLSCTLLFMIKLNKDLMRIKTDWENTFIDRKKFFKSCSFSGQIISKTFMKNGNLPYSLTIMLDDNTLIPEWDERTFYQYYQFDSEKRLLKLSVSEYVYRNTVENDLIIKEGKSDSIFINDKVYELLSNESLKWIP